MLCTTGLGSCHVETYFAGCAPQVVVKRASWGSSFFLDSMCGAAWSFLFGEVICLVNYFYDRDLSQLNSVQHVSH